MYLCLLPVNAQHELLKGGRRSGQNDILDSMIQTVCPNRTSASLLRFCRINLSKHAYRLYCEVVSVQIAFDAWRSVQGLDVDAVCLGYVYCLRATRRHNALLEMMGQTRGSGVSKLRVANKKSMACKGLHNRASLVQRLARSEDGRLR